MSVKMLIEDTGVFQWNDSRYSVPKDKSQVIVKRRNSACQVSTYVAIYNSKKDKYWFEGHFYDALFWSYIPAIPKISAFENLIKKLEDHEGLTDEESEFLARLLNAHGENT